MKELVIRVTQDSFDKTSRWLEVSHNGGAAWSTVLINNDEEAFQIISALQQSVQADFAAECAYDEPCKQCIHPVCKNYAKRQNR